MTEIQTMKAMLDMQGVRPYGRKPSKCMTCPISNSICEKALVQYNSYNLVAMLDARIAACKKALTKLANEHPEQLLEELL